VHAQSLLWATKPSRREALECSRQGALRSILQREKPKAPVVVIASYGLVVVQLVTQLADPVEVPPEATLEALLVPPELVPPEPKVQVPA